MIGKAMVTSAKHMTLSLPCASLPQEMHSVASVAPPSPPNTVLSVVIWIEALCGVGSTLPWRVRTLVAVRSEERRVGKGRGSRGWRGVGRRMGERDVGG